jgi:DNA-binding NtrC family response regulator
MPRTDSPIRVVIADDERIIADTLAMILNARGFYAVSAYSGETAVELARALRPDVLISDFAMGEVSGMDAALAIMQMLPRCRVLFITAQTTLPDAEAFQIRGWEFEVLQKPFQPEDLLRQLDRIDEIPRTEEGRQKSRKEDRSASARAEALTAE